MWGNVAGELVADLKFPTVGGSHCLILHGAAGLLQHSDLANSTQIGSIRQIVGSLRSQIYQKGRILLRLLMRSGYGPIPVSG